MMKISIGRDDGRMKTETVVGTIQTRKDQEALNGGTTEIEDHGMILEQSLGFTALRKETEGDTDRDRRLSPRSWTGRIAV